MDIASICAGISAATPATQKYYTPSAKERQVQRQKFEQTGENPVFTYPKINTVSITANLNRLFQLGSEVVEADLPHYIEHTLMDKITELADKNFLILATATGDWEKFREMGEKLFGQPDIGLYYNFLTQVNTNLLNLGESVLGLGELDSLIELLDSIELDSISWNSSSSVVQTVLSQELSFLIETDDSDYRKECDATEIKQAFERKLILLGLNNWRVEINPDRIKLAVNKSKRLIIVPASRKMTRRQLKLKLAHELFHVHRYESARLLPETAAFPLLSAGLSKYQRGEEGLALLLEAIAGGTSFQACGRESYLAHSLAFGVDDSQERDFAQVYQLMWPIIKLRLINEIREESPEEVLDPDNPAFDQKVSDETWTRCEKTFRGGPFAAGTPNLGDLIYGGGAHDVHETLTQIPALAKYLWLGKYDPANSDHRHLLHELGVLPGSLV